MKEYNPSYIGILASGLRGFSRVLEAVSGDKVPLDTKLNALMVDSLAWLVWSKTEDAEHNRNKPSSIYSLIVGEDKKTAKQDGVSFKTSEEFEKARERILRGK